MLVATIGKRAVTAAPAESQDKACDAFVEASKAAQAYADVATVNLDQNSTLSHGSARLSKFDTHRMAAALEQRESGGTLHYVLYTVADKKLTPISLQMLWSIQSKIIFVNLTADVRKPSIKWEELKEKCLAILVESQLLAQVFAYAGNVCNAGLGGQIAELFRPGAPSSPSPQLTLLATQHQIDVRRLSAKLRSDFPDSKVVADQLAAFVPVNLPVWMAYKDDPDAHVVNDVYFPGQYAKPLLKGLAEDQAKSMSQH